MTQTIPAIQTRRAAAALVALIVLQGIMLSALYAGISPHPPVAPPLFGIAPFIGASLATAGAALIMGQGAAGRWLSILAALLALVSFGPQKYFDPQITLIWPSVLAGQVAAVTLLYGALAQVVRGRPVAVA